MKNKVVTIIIIIATIILAGVAIFTAIRLYQLRQEAVAPTAPEQPAAATPTPPEYEACTTLTFTISTPAPGVCNTTCSINSDCDSNYCYTVTCPPGENCIDVVQKYCRNSDCPTDTDCVCSGATATPTATPTPTGTATATPGATTTPSSSATASPTGTAVARATATPQGELPEAGTTLPTIFGIGAGVILLIISIALAL